mgnify:CR=1 FL=1
MHKRIAKEDRHEQLLNAACELFAKKGFDGTTMKDIAARAGVTPPLLNQHFNSKEDIYSELYERWCEDVKKIAVIPIIDGSAIATIENLLKEELEQDSWYFEKLSGRDVLLDQAVRNRVGISKLLTAGLKRGSDVVTDSILPVVQFGIDAGEIRRGDAKAIANIIWTILGGLRNQRRNFAERFYLPTIYMLLELLKNDCINN